MHRNLIRSGLNQNQIDSHCDSNECQEHSEDDSAARWLREIRFSPTEAANDPNVMPGSKDIDDYSTSNERRAEPDRQSVRLCVEAGFDDTKLLQEKAEPRHDESETHEREASAN